MSAVTIYDHAGEELAVRFDIGMTILSLILVLAFSLLGFYISSHDKVFMKNKRQIVELLIEDTASLTFRDISNIKSTQILWIMGTHYPYHLLGGGLCTGSGVVVMHYVGMAAMRFPGTIVWNEGIIAASIFIAFVASTAAFWILFRLLSMYSNKENLRIACALTMAIAVCGMHYVGMVAAEFNVDTTINVSVGTTMSTHQAFVFGLLFAGLAALISLIVALSDLRYSVSKLIVELSRADQMIIHMPVASSQGCANTVQKYLNKRKASNFNLGVINHTMIFETDPDDNSVQSLSCHPAGHSGHGGHGGHGGRDLASLSVHRSSGSDNHSYHQHPHHNDHPHKQIHPAEKYHDLKNGGDNNSHNNSRVSSHVNSQNNSHDNSYNNSHDNSYEYSPCGDASPVKVFAEGVDDEMVRPLGLPKSLRIKVAPASVPAGSDKTTTALSTASQIDRVDFSFQDLPQP